MRGQGGTCVCWSFSLPRLLSAMRRPVGCGRCLPESGRTYRRLVGEQLADGKRMWAGHWGLTESISGPAGRVGAPRPEIESLSQICESWAGLADRHIRPVDGRVIAIDSSRRNDASGLGASTTNQCPLVPGPLPRGALSCGGPVFLIELRGSCATTNDGIEAGTALGTIKRANKKC